MLRFIHTKNLTLWLWFRFVAIFWSDKDHRNMERHLAIRYLPLSAGLFRACQFRNCLPAPAPSPPYGYWGWNSSHPAEACLHHIVGFSWSLALEFSLTPTGSTAVEKGKLRLEGWTYFWIYVILGAKAIGSFWGKCTWDKWAKIIKITCGCFNYFSVIKIRV